jgi:hypothetical protein
MNHPPGLIAHLALYEIVIKLTPLASARLLGNDFSIQ